MIEVCMCLFEMQLREFLEISLYGDASGYFTKQDGLPPVAALDHAIDFPSLSDRHEYLYEVKKRYDELGNSWLTPAEIFSPYYGRTITRYILHKHLAFATSVEGGLDNGNELKSPSIEHLDNIPKLSIYEIGGGTGTLAKDVLNCLKSNYEMVYKKTCYTIIEISPSLAKIQHDTLINSGHQPRSNTDNGCFRILNGNALHSQTWEGLSDTDHECSKNIGNSTTRNRSGETCFVLAMEVLDNCVHDKIQWNISDSAWREAMVYLDEDNNSLIERMCPLSDDELINRCLTTWMQAKENDKIADACSTFGTKHLFKSTITSTRKYLYNILNFVLGNGVDASPDSLFLPTGALQLFDTLHTVRPRHHLLAIDFDFLPEVQIPGWNAPLVSQTKNRKCLDYDSYLKHPGEVDIFFPSDFRFLSRLYQDSARYCTKHESSLGIPSSERHSMPQVLKSSDFFSKWISEEDRISASTRSGYVPILEDYSNTSVLVS